MAVGSLKVRGVGLGSGAEPLERRTLTVENPNLEGLKVEAIPGRQETGVTVSRIRRGGEAEVHLAAGGTVLKNGDHIVAVGTGAMLDRFQQVVGRRSDEDLFQAPGGVTTLRVVVPTSAPSESRPGGALL